MLLSEFHKSLY